MRLDDPTQYQSIVDAEWNIIYDKLDKCAQSGAKIVLSRLAVGDLATQYFADRDIFCAGRVSGFTYPQRLWLAWGWREGIGVFELMGRGAGLSF